MVTSVHAVAAKMVVAAAEMWLGTKVSDVVTTVSAAAAIAMTATVVSFAVAFSHCHQHCHRRHRCGCRFPCLF
jgi:hypothetical protein